MMNLLYSPVNQRWFLVWNNQVIGGYDTRDEARVDLRYKRLELRSNGQVVSI